MMVSSRSEALKLANELNIITEKLIQFENLENAELHTKSVTTTLKFTKQEISRMAETFKREFIANGLSAHIIKRKSGKSTYCYEIRYRSNGYSITASSVDLQIAKRKFLEKTTANQIEKYRCEKQKTNVDTLEKVFEEWFQYKKGTITDKTMQKFYSHFQSLPVELRKKSITAVRTVDLDTVMKNVKPRKYEDLRTLFNSIYKYAIASGLVTNNPVSLIKFKKAERQSRDSLAVDEIKSFLKRLNQPKFDEIRQGVCMLYFFGLRPCEADEEVRREGNFIVARNRKRKNGKIEYKKIPIPKQAEEFIDWNKPLCFPTRRKLAQAELIKELLDGKTGYYLRHTFSTICQQYVRPDIVDIWMGDSPQRLVGKVYTHFPDEFMGEQMDKVEFPT